MIFEIVDNKLVVVYQEQYLKELELEHYLISTSENDFNVLNSSVFGEPLFIIDNEVKTKDKKRADILAIDINGNGVVIEMKKDSGSLGVETQALQYLADFSKYKGQQFVKRFCKNKNYTEDDLYSFLGSDFNSDNINKNSRIILLARSFEPSIYSMGEWLAEKGVAFRCIQYNSVLLDKRKLISFSISFDKSNTNLYPFIFSNNLREPKIFWHNIGYAEQKWWDYLVKEEVITTNFDCAPNDQGEKILRSYVKNDQIIAFAKGCGAVGLGQIYNPESYRLYAKGSKEDIKNGKHLHRLKIKWKFIAEDIFKDSIPTDFIKKNLGIYHPVSTSVTIDKEKGKHLIEHIQKVLKKI